MSDEQPRDKDGKFASAGGSGGLKAWAGKTPSKKDHLDRAEHHAKVAREAESDGNHDWAATNHLNAASAYDKAGKSQKAADHRTAARNSQANGDRVGGHYPGKSLAMRSIKETINQYK